MGLVQTSIREYEHPPLMRLGYSRSATTKYPAFWSASITISPAERRPEPLEPVKIIFTTKEERRNKKEGFINNPLYDYDLYLCI